MSYYKYNSSDENDIDNEYIESSDKIQSKNNNLDRYDSSDEDNEYIESYNKIQPKYNNLISYINNEKICLKLYINKITFRLSKLKNKYYTKKFLTTPHLFDNIKFKKYKDNKTSIK